MRKLEAASDAQGTVGNVDYVVIVKAEILLDLMREQSLSFHGTE